MSGCELVDIQPCLGVGRFEFVVINDALGPQSFEQIEVQLVARGWAEDDDNEADATGVILIEDGHIVRGNASDCAAGVFTLSRFDNGEAKVAHVRALRLSVLPGDNDAVGCGEVIAARIRRNIVLNTQNDCVRLSGLLKGG